MEWSAAQMNDLPDSAFLHVEAGGSKDAEGKTIPRGLRHFPVKGSDGKADLPHLRNALARIPQSMLSAEAKAEAKRKAVALAKEHGIDVTESVKVTEAEDLCLLAEAAPAGAEWDVRILAAGRSKNGNVYPAEVLARDASLFEGASVFAYELAKGLLDHLPGHVKQGVGDGGGLLRNLVGTLEGVHFAERDGKAGLYGRLKVVTPWVKETLRGAWEAGKKTLIGMSIDARAMLEAAADGTKTVIGFGPNPTVDLVSHPAAGGELVRLVASSGAGTTMDEKARKELVERLLKDAGLPEPAKARLTESLVARADLDEAKAKAAIDAEKEYLKKVSESAPKAAAAAGTPLVAGTVEDPAGAAGAAQGAAGTPAIRPQPLKESDVTGMVQRTLVANGLVEQKLRDSGLPVAAATRVRESAFAGGKLPDAAGLDAAIKAERDYLIAVGGRPAVTGAGAARESAAAGADEIDRFQVAMDGFFAGEDLKLLGKDLVPRFRSLKEAFYHLTGKALGIDCGPEELLGAAGGYKPVQFSHRWTPSRESALEVGAGFRRVAEAVLTTTFAQVLGDSIARRMRAEYLLPELQDWRKIVTVENVQDFRTQRRTFYGGYGTLTVVGESENYPLATTPGDDEETYAVTKRGLRERLTIEAIANDDVGLIRRIPSRLGRAAVETLYRAVFDVFTANADMYDATALFVAGHSNTDTDVLNGENLRAAIVAMMDQTAYGNTSEILGLANLPKYLLVPHELYHLAWLLTNSAAAVTEMVTTSAPADMNATTPNDPHFRQIEPIAVRHWTDATDWFLSADPRRTPTIEVGFWQGRQEPELFVQDDPRQGSMFSADVVEYKIRQVYGVKPLDWRGLYRNVAAG